MWRILLMVAMLLHGIGHGLFLMNAWGYWKEGRGRAWLFADVLQVTQTSEGLIGLLWLVPLIGFVVGAWGLFVQQAWWGSLALTVAILSSAIILLWWNGLNTSSAAFALLFNVVVVAAVILQPRMLQAAGV